MVSDRVLDPAVIRAAVAAAGYELIDGSVTDAQA